MARETIPPILFSCPMENSIDVMVRIANVPRGLTDKEADKIIRVLSNWGQYFREISMAHDKNEPPKPQQEKE